MTIKTIGLLTFLTTTFLIVSCDRVANHELLVINKLSKSIKVKFIDTNLFSDSLKTFVINSGDSSIIKTQHTGILGEKEIPRDYHLKFDTFTMVAQFRVEVGNVVLKKNLGLSKEWTYDAVNTSLGVYRLQIDSTDIY